MIIADFTTGALGIIQGLWQYDYGQVLRIQGLDLPTAAEIHFSLQDTGGEAVTRIGTTKDGVTDVTIPDSMLENDGAAEDYRIYVFVYLSDDASGETVKKLSLSVKSRPKPEAFDTPGDEELFRQTIAAVNDAATRAAASQQAASDSAAQAHEDALQTTADREAVAELVKSVENVDEEVELVKTLSQQARQYKDDSQAAAQSAEQSKNSALEAATSAKGAADSAAESAKSALEAAGSATQAADSASGSAKSASEAATSAQNSATSAGESATSASQAAESALGAKTSAEQAASSALQSATSASGAASSAQQSASSAEQSATSAQQSATNAAAAEGYATTAQTAANNAVQAASQVSGKTEQIDQNTSDIDALYNGKADIIQNEASGHQIVLRDSANVKIKDLGMTGKTEQVTTTGAQLIDTNQLTIGGINGSSGENYNTQSRIRTDAYIPVDAKCTYTLSGYSPYNFANGIVYDESKTKIGLLNSNIKIPEGGKYIRLSFSKNDQSNFTDDELEALKTTIMLNYGSAAFPWEPYTGGSPSPSPDYPQPIINGGTYDEDTQKWEYQVDVTGKNLLPFGEGYLSVGIPKQTRGRTYILNEDGSINITTQDSSQSTGSIFIFSDSSGSKMLKLNPGTYSASTFCSSNIPIRIQICDKDKNDIRVVMSISETFTINDGEYIKCAWLYGEEGVDWNATIYPQIEPNERTTYEPYKHQSITLTADRPLTKWDKLEKRNGQWGWVYKSSEVVLDGSNDEAWIKYAEQEDYTIFYRVFIDATTGLDTSFCNKFKNLKNTQAWTNGEPWGYSDHPSSRNKYFCCANDTATELTQWKTWLSSNPITVLYQAAAETFTPLSESEQEALAALGTYYPNTVITNNVDSNMQLTYFADTKNYIDAKFAELQQSLANTNAQLLGGN